MAKRKETNLPEVKLGKIETRRDVGQAMIELRRQFTRLDKAGKQLAEDQLLELEELFAKITYRGDMRKKINDFRNNAKRLVREINNYKKELATAQTQTEELAPPEPAPAQEIPAPPSQAEIVLPQSAIDYKAPVLPPPALAPEAERAQDLSEIKDEVDEIYNLIMERFAKMDEKDKRIIEEDVGLLKAMYANLEESASDTQLEYFAEVASKLLKKLQEIARMKELVAQAEASKPIKQEREATPPPLPSIEPEIAVEPEEEKVIEVEPEDILEEIDAKEEVVEYQNDTHSVMIDVDEPRSMEDVSEEERKLEYEGFYGHISARCDYGGEGSKYKNKNEDSMFVGSSKKDGSLFCGVVDGAGGSGNGLEASIVATEALSYALANGDSMAEALNHANERVEKLAKEKKEEWEKQVKARGGHVREEKFNPPYCCAVSVEIKKDGKVKLGWSGDSKAITLRDGEKLKEGATIMQNVAAKFVAGDAIEPEDYFNSPYNNQITGALGLASTKGTDKPEIKEFQGQNGDRIILASDGVWDMVSEEEVQALSEQYTAPQKLQEKIFQLALERNNAQQPFVIKTENKDGIMASVNMNAKFGRGDNITVQVVELRNIGVEHPAFIKEAPIETKQPPVAEEAEVFEAEPPIEIPAIPEIPRDRVDILTEELKKAQIELAEAIVNKDKNQGFFRGLFNKKAKQEAEERYATALDNKCRLEVELQQETEKRGSRLLEALKSHSKDFLDITAKQYEAKENVVSRAWKAMGGMNFGSLVSKLEARASDSTLIGQCVKEFAQKSKKVLEENKVARVVNQVASVRSVVSAGLLGGSVLGIPGFTSTRVAFGALGTGMGTRAGSDAIYNWYSRWFGRRADVFYTTQQAKQVWDEKMDKAGKLGKIYLKVMGKLHKKNFLSEEPETALENIDEAISAYESYAYVNNIPLEQVAKQDENYARLLQMQETAMEEIMAKMSEQAVSELGGWTNLDHVDIKVAEQYLDLHAERQKKQMDALLKNIKAERRAVAAKRLLSVAAGAAGGMLAAYYALKRVGKMTDLGAEAPPTEAPTPAESEVPTTKASAPEAPPSAEPSAPTPKPEPTAPESEPEVIGEPQAEAPEEVSFLPEGEDVGIMNDILEEKKFFAIPKNFGFLRAAESFQTEYKDQLLEAVKTHAPKWFKQGMSDEQILHNWRVDVNGAHGGRIVPEGEWVKIEPKPNARMLISTEYPYLKLDESDPSLFKVHKKPFLRPRINK